MINTFLAVIIHLWMCGCIHYLSELFISERERASERAGECQTIREDEMNGRDRPDERICVFVSVRAPT